jgi:hypothetical protein
MQEKKVQKRRERILEICRQEMAPERLKQVVTSSFKICLNASTSQPVTLFIGTTALLTLTSLFLPRLVKAVQYAAPLAEEISPSFSKYAKTYLSLTHWGNYLRTGCKSSPEFGFFYDKSKSYIKNNAKCLLGAGCVGGIIAASGTRLIYLLYLDNELNICWDNNISTIQRYQAELYKLKTDK